MIKIIRGKYGPKLLGPGTILKLDASHEQRLVNTKIAEYVENESVRDEFPDSDIELKSKEELQKIRAKKELIIYAESIGFHDLKENSRKDMIEAILNYQEEEFDLDESDNQDESGVQQGQLDQDASDDQPEQE